MPPKKKPAPTPKKPAPKSIAKAKPKPKPVKATRAAKPTPKPTAKQKAKRTVTAIANFVMIAITSLRPSPSNPRKRFDEAKLEELAASIREQGVLEPILVRPFGAKSYEIVAGERRWRAAKIAGLAEIPCMSRELSNRQVLEVQIAENLQRADMTPLEEADALARLQSEHKCTIFEIADRIGRPTKYVEQRLRIAKLDEGVRELLDKNKIGLGGALLVGAFGADEQKRIARALESTQSSAWRRTRPLTVNEVMEELRRFSTALERATFPIDDASLVPTAGSCKVCPKNSATQLSLIDDVSQDATCLERACWDSKVEAQWVRQRAEAEAKGMKVIEGKPYEFVRPTDTAFELDEDDLDESDESEGDDEEEHDAKPKAMPPTWGELVPVEERVLVRAPDGRVFEGITREARDRALERAGKAPKADGEDGSHIPRGRDLERERVIKDATEARALAGIVAAVEDEDAIDALLWPIIAYALTGDTYEDACENVVKRRGWDADDKDPQSYALVVREKMEELCGVELRALVFDLVFSDRWAREDGAFERALDLAKFDFDAELEVTRAQLLEAERAKAEAPPETSKKTRAKKADPTKEIEL